MSSFFHRPYVPAAQRRQAAAKAAKKMAKNGQSLAPVTIEGRQIAKSFWGQSWCKNLESYSDYENRLPRGRTYARNGSVLDLQISSGEVHALVQGSSLYKIKISIDSLPKAQWKTFCDQCAGKVTSLLDLLQGRLPKGVLEDISHRTNGLFPSPKQIKLSCSCPDWADMCKHVAAALYGVGARLDQQPDLFFTLRGVDMKDLVTAATVSATKTTEISGGNALADEDLSALFGVDVETSKSTDKKTVPVAATKTISKPKKAAKAKTSAPLSVVKRVRKKA